MASPTAGIALGGPSSIPIPCPKRAQFLGKLFGLLDEYEIRYCVLHGYENLPENFSGDLDIVVHPDDVRHLPAICRSLAADGFRPVQCLEYAIRGRCVVFAWTTGGRLETAAVDFITEYRRAGRRLALPCELLGDRERRRNFWVAAPEVEFRYLLTKKTLKGTLDASQAGRLHYLSREIGLDATQRITQELFGTQLGSRATDAIQTGRLGSVLPVLRRRLWLSGPVQHPLEVVRCVVQEFGRIVRRIGRPTGLFLAVLGPDGAGKSTLIDGLRKETLSLFRRQRVLHWRPMFLWNRRQGGIVTDPHGRPPRSRLVSLLRLLLYALDYISGYVLRVRPLLTRSGIVIFDRYYDDMAVDPKRFRFPDGFSPVRRLRPLIPRPDLTLLLDAPILVLRGRKQEVALAEARRQRREFQNLARWAGTAIICDASADRASVTSEATRHIVEALDRRFQARYPDWTTLPLTDEGGASPNNGLSLRCNFEQALGILSGRRTKQTKPEDSRHQPRNARPHLRRVRQTPRNKLLVLPSLETPQWLLPLGDLKLTTAALRSRPVYAPGARLWKFLLLTEGGARITSRFGPKITLPREQLEPLRDLAVDKLRIEPAAFSLTLGTPSKRAKATVTLFDTAGRPLAILKLALAPEAEERISREAAALQRLRQFHLLRSHIPEVLYAGRWNGTNVILQTPVGESQGPLQFGSAHQVFERSLASVCRTPRPGSDLVGETVRAWRVAAERLDAPWLITAKATLSWVSEELANRPVPCGIAHGDFAPWNTRITGEQLKVFDWESLRWDAPPGWDRFHFEVQVRSHLPHKRLKPWQPAEALKAVFALYLVQSLCRGAPDGMPDHEVRYRESRLRRLKMP